MPIPLLDLSLQYTQIQAEIDDVLRDVMVRASFIGGPRVADFENRIAEYCGTRYAVGCASGTDALVLILDAMGIGAGDEVITTPFTFFATAEAISRVGATPVFVDIEPDTCNIDHRLIEAAITERTKAIMPVHIFGQCADMAAIRAIADRYSLRVIEDACQAIGATYRGRHAGSLADAAAFSFFPSKNLGGAGDGGMVTTDDESLAVRVRMLANHGTRTKYYHAELGYNSRLDALQAAILLVKLPHLDTWNRQRREAAARYDQMLAGLPLVLPTVRDHGESVYHLYVIRTTESARVMEALNAEGIGTARYYPRALHLQEVYRDLGYVPGALPMAEEAQEQSFAIPCFPGISIDQQLAVVDVLRSVLE